MLCINLQGFLCLMKSTIDRKNMGLLFYIFASLKYELVCIRKKKFGSNIDFCFTLPKKQNTFPSALILSTAFQESFFLGYIKEDYRKLTAYL
ncbi:hypothetical protein SAMN04489761_0904 [Tenacibaculum sp. MAR_2009_124]|nr:hypothetical protein SAMN04489761_0904 [Tenacibaculum sp. MAR_2009_124]